MEGLGAVAAVQIRIGERSDRIDELQDRTRPAVDEHQWNSTGRCRPHMQKMHHSTVDHGGVLREAVDARLVLAPVITRAPVLGELHEIAHRNTAFPGRAWQFPGPAGSME